jgi:2-polyprenyl-6-hydroxyphenyl methylase/3-demethylubiquinone-9 3-methyltransferase
MNMPEISGYKFTNAEYNCAHAYLLPIVMAELSKLKVGLPNKNQLFELGCGNGSVANALSNIGWNVTGVDPSIEGITIANQSYPTLQLELGSAYDDLFSRYGQFPIVISLEVVEHVYFPRQYATTLFNLVEPGGTAIISTPYHGYWKNLVIAIFGKMDKHFTALWDNGHIKFWSVKTLRILLRDAGFKNIRFTRVGRISPFAKSMVAIANKP